MGTGPSIRSGATRRLFRVGLCVVALLLLVGLLLGLIFGRENRRFVVQSFNEQQLLVARQARSLIHHGLEQVRGELRLLSRGLAGAGPGEQADRLRESLLRMQEAGGRWIGTVDWGSATAVGLGTGAVELESRSLSDADPLRPDWKALCPGEVWTSPVVADGSTVSLVLAIPLDDPVKRALVLEMNVAWFLTPFLRHLRSGRTGYAWVIDEEGRFLYHPDATFVGQDAFVARSRKYPGVSFVRIHLIQEERMLRGEEGTGSYVSAWHRGITGEIEKLIAFTPIEISNDPSRSWSVAVAAPLYEIEEEIGRSYTRQLVAQGVLVTLAILAALSILLVERRWSGTLQRRVEEQTAELRRSRERYRSLVESSEDYILTLDRDLVVRSVNAYTARFFGRSPGDLIGVSFMDLLSKETGPQEGRRVERVFATGRSLRAEFALPFKDDCIWVNSSYMPLTDERGEVSLVLCVARDITEQKELQRSLVQAEKLASLGTLAAGFAHEINNPLGVILGFCDLLLKNAEEGSRVREDLEIIERQGLHCKEIVENLLSFARAEEETEGPADLNLCIRDVVRVVRHSLEMKKIVLHLDLAPDLPSVRGDPRRHQQVLLNLVNNAADALEEGGEVRVRTDWDRSRRLVVAVVEDDGPGIRPDDLPHIFEPFFTTKAAGKGTGLGLFVSYGILARFNGTINCTSRPAEESGRRGRTTFTITLPAVGGGSP